MYSKHQKYVIPKLHDEALIQEIQNRVMAYEHKDIPGMLLQNMVLDLNHEEKVPTFAPLPKASDKYRVVSALQKSIRRGDMEFAIKCAGLLHGHDDTYLWRRLAIICLEDLGMMGIELAGFAFTYGGQKKLRQKYGSLHLTLALVEQMTLSVKDRSLCELCNSADAPIIQEKILPLFSEELTKEEYLESVSTGLLSMQWAVSRKWAGLWSNKTKTGYESSPGHRTDYFEYIDSLDLPELVKYVVKLGVKRGAEGLPVALPFAWRGWLATHQHEIRPMALTETPIINGLPSCAYDGHCYEGKKAMAYFRKACAPVKQWLEDNFEGDALRFLKSAIFFAEGGMVLKEYVHNAYWRHVYDLSMRGEARRYGLTYEKMMEFYTLVGANIATLNKSRERVMS